MRPYNRNDCGGFSINYHLFYYDERLNDSVKREREKVRSNNNMWR